MWLLDAALFLVQVFLAMCFWASIALIGMYALASRVSAPPRAPKPKTDAEVVKELLDKL